MDLLNELWTETRSTRFIVAIKDKVVKHVPINDRRLIRPVATALTGKGYDVYFSIAGFTPDGSSKKGRSQGEASTVSALWCDIDVGDSHAEKDCYPSNEAALTAVVVECKALGLPMPSRVVASGHGLHLYWLLDGEYTREEWEPTASLFKRVLLSRGVKIDPTRTADIASILRVPNTKNFKDPDAVVDVLPLGGTGARHKLKDIHDALPPLGPSHIVYSDPLQSEWAVETTFPLGDAEQIATRCAQVGHMRDTRGVMPEPLWRANLSILQRCKDGEHYVKEWSKGDPRYNEAEALNKAKLTACPATCAYFQEHNPDACRGCPLAGKITSPIQAYRAAPAPDPLPEPDTGAGTGADAGTDWRLYQVGRFVVDESGVAYNPAAEDEPPESALMVPLWVADVRTKHREGDSAGSATIEVEFVNLSGSVERATMDARVLADKREFAKWLSDYLLFPAVVKEGLVRMYISQYTAAVLRKKKATVYYDRLGWVKDGFVLGSRIINSKGPTPALVQSSTPISDIAPCGSLDVWKRCAATLGRDHLKGHAFAMLAAFGSPLLALVNKESAVVSLSGPSGAGKTLAASVALSIYGDPSLLMQGSSSTNNAIEQQLVANNNVPYLLDEITQYKANRLTSLIYMIANGVGKASLNRNRETRAAGRWRNVTFVTSNKPVLEFAHREVEEAHRRRVLELYFPTALSRADAEQIVPMVNDHFGVAAAPYLETVAAVRDKMPAMFEAVEAKLVEKLNVPSSNRFGLWTLTAAWLGGALAKQAGLIDWDVNSIIEFAAAALKNNVDDTLTDEERAAEAVSEWITEHSKQISVWSGGTNLGIPVDDPVARYISKDGVLCLHSSRIMEELWAQGISKSAANRFFDGLQAEKKSVRLASGTSAVRCLVVPADSVGFNVGE